MGEALMPRRIGGKNGIIETLISLNGNYPGDCMASEHFVPVATRLKDGLESGYDPDNEENYEFLRPAIFIYNFDAYGVSEAGDPDFVVPYVVALLVEPHDDWTHTITLIVSADGVNFEVLKETTTDRYCCECSEKFYFSFEGSSGYSMYLDGEGYHFKPDTEYNCIIVK